MLGSGQSFDAVSCGWAMLAAPIREVGAMNMDRLVLL